MLLVEVKESDGWISSRWNLTYNVGWEHICKAAHCMYEFYMQPEVLCDDRPVAIQQQADILKLEEGRKLTIRGLSTVIGVPVMISFVNQTNIAEVFVAQATEEFSEADYQKFNISLCQFMDSIELAMYR